MWLKRDEDSENTVAAYASEPVLHTSCPVVCHIYTDGVRSIGRILAREQAKRIVEE